MIRSGKMRWGKMSVCERVAPTCCILEMIWPARPALTAWGFTKHRVVLAPKSHFPTPAYRQAAAIFMHGHRLKILTCAGLLPKTSTLWFHCCSFPLRYTHLPLEGQSVLNCHLPLSRGIPTLVFPSQVSLIPLRQQAFSMFCTG